MYNVLVPSSCSLKQCHRIGEHAVETRDRVERMLSLLFLKIDEQERYTACIE
jgi:hypothetical protein